MTKTPTLSIFIQSLLMLSSGSPSASPQAPKQSPKPSPTHLEQYLYLYRDLQFFLDFRFRAVQLVIYPDDGDCTTVDHRPFIFERMSLRNFAVEGAQRKTRRGWDYFLDDIREDIVLESQLLLLSFATGVQDAAAWTDYACFASNQTGNTLFLAIGVAGLANNAYSFQNIGMSLGSFVAGGLVMGQIGNQMGVRKRFWLLITSIIQTAMVFVAAAISHYFQDASAALLALFLLAFSSGAQVAMSRSLKITEITTAMATAAYVDVVVDPVILQRHNRLRNRRILFLAMLTAGCFGGAFVVKAVNSTLALVLCGACKTIVTLVFFFNRAIS